jgi:hypothetical protein
MPRILMKPLGNETLTELSIIKDKHALGILTRRGVVLEAILLTGQPVDVVWLAGLLEWTPRAVGEHVQHLRKTGLID